MTPPRLNSRASDLSSIGSVPPLKPAINSWPICRRSGAIVAQIIIRGVHTAASAPTRIDLAGGTIDIWPLYLFHDGAATLNAAISLRAQVTLEGRGEEGIRLQSLDTSREVTVRHWSDLDPAGQLPLLARAARHY